jgi:hypothetical protein
VALVALLLKHGADPNALDRQTGSTALHIAVSKGRHFAFVFLFQFLFVFLLFVGQIFFPTLQRFVLICCFR